MYFAVGMCSTWHSGALIVVWRTLNALAIEISLNSELILLVSGSVPRTGFERGSPLR